jgi:hypothetical protein
MAKWYGKIGFGLSEETSPGVWKPNIVEKPYCGDIFKTTSKIVSSENQNDDIRISNEISIVADPFANLNFHSIRYVEFMGALHKVDNVSVQCPRLILSVGGVYNGKQA